MTPDRWLRYSRLESVNLEAYPLATNEVVEILARNRSLMRLNLNGCFHVTDRGFAHLRGMHGALANVVHGGICAVLV
jgi:hypothetical protein